MFAVIAFSFGIPTGFLYVTLPYLASQGGLNLLQVGSITGMALTANFLKILWMPVVDMGKTLRWWTGWGVVLSALALFGLSIMPMRTDLFWVIAGLAFVSTAASTLPAIAGAGLMAVCLTEDCKGAASGAWQGGSLFATGLGGAASLWAFTTFGTLTGGAVAAALTMVGAAVLPLMREPDHVREPGVIKRIKVIAGELYSVTRDPRGALFILIVCTPLGVGAASFLWSGIAEEWNVGPGEISMVVGIGAALASAAGAFGYGLIANRLDRLDALVLSGVMIAVIAAVMAFLPRTPIVFDTGVLLYAFGMGIAYASFTAVILQVVGRGAAATKYAAINAFGNVPVAYMPVALGWLHDGWSSTAMLVGEAGLGIAAAIFAVLAARAIRWKARTRLAIWRTEGREEPPAPAAPVVPAEIYAS